MYMYVKYGINILLTDEKSNWKTKNKCFMVLRHSYIFVKRCTFICHILKRRILSQFFNFKLKNWVSHLSKSRKYMPATFRSVKWYFDFFLALVHRWWRVAPLDFWGRCSNGISKGNGKDQAICSGALLLWSTTRAVHVWHNLVTRT